MNTQQDDPHHRRAGALKVFGLFFIVLAFLTALHLFFYPGEEMEMGAYSSYPRSLLADGDLNVFGQMPASTSWLVTATYNHPNYYDHGVALLWLPFYFYEKLVTALDSTVYSDLPAHWLIVSLTNSFFAILGLLLLWRVLRMHAGIDAKDAGTVLLSLVFGTPLFFCLFLDPSNSDVASFFIVSLVTYSLFALALRSSIEWFLVGATIAFAMTVKVNIWTFLPFFLFIAAERLKNRRNARFPVSALLGYAVVASAWIINIRIKNGAFYFPYSWLSSMHDFFIPVESLFGKAGYLQSTPLLALPFGVAALLPLRARAHWKQAEFKFVWQLSVLAILIPLAHTAAASFRFVMGQFYFPFTRFLVVFTPLFALSMGFAYKCAGKRSRAALSAFLLLSAGWHVLLSLFIYRKGALKPVGIFDFGGKMVSQVIFQDFPNRAHLFLETVSQVVPAAIASLPLILASAFLLSHAWMHERIQPLLLRFSLGVVFLGYLGISISNGHFNSINVKRLQAHGAFANCVVARGPNSFFYDEVTDVVNVSREYFTQVGESSMLPRIDQWYSGYLRSVRQEVLFDPIGFGSDMEKGKIRPTYWNSGK